MTNELARQVVDLALRAYKERLRNKEKLVSGRLEREQKVFYFILFYYLLYFIIFFLYIYLNFVYLFI